MSRPKKPEKGPPLTTNLIVLCPQGSCARAWEAGQAHTKPPTKCREALEPCEKCRQARNKPKKRAHPADLNVLRGGRKEQKPPAGTDTPMGGEGGPESEKCATPSKPSKAEHARRAEKSARATPRHTTPFTRKTPTARLQGGRKRGRDSGKLRPDGGRHRKTKGQHNRHQPKATLVKMPAPERKKEMQ